MIRVFLGAAALLMLSGCSALNPWDGDYACRGYPKGVTCISARQVYELTNYRDSLSPRDGKKGRVRPDRGYQGEGKGGAYDW
jgi:conjugal transfer pilus assembly protein TraV